ncbi:hypothetical protein ASG99_14740 [Bacillus sp. Soil768D1]|nr:hypothetical protein ASG99_14740 [Bacillus sp. Soil768D1]
MKKNSLHFKPATENEVSIMTLHKSKGLEFKCVFLLDLYRWILPPEGMRVTNEDCPQALNLLYVGVTRAIDACYIIKALKGIELKKKIIGQQKNLHSYILTIRQTYAKLLLGKIIY